MILKQATLTQTVSSAISEDRPIKVFNHGNMSIDFTYIDDIVDGIGKFMKWYKSFYLEKGNEKND